MATIFAGTVLAVGGTLLTRMVVDVRRHKARLRQHEARTTGPQRGAADQGDGDNADDVAEQGAASQRSGSASPPRRESAGGGSGESLAPTTVLPGRASTEDHGNGAAVATARSPPGTGAPPPADPPRQQRKQRGFGVGLFVPGLVLDARRLLNDVVMYKSDDVAGYQAVEVARSVDRVAGKVPGLLQSVQRERTADAINAALDATAVLSEALDTLVELMEAHEAVRPLAAARDCKGRCDGLSTTLNKYTQSILATQSQALAFPTVRRPWFSRL